MNEEKIIKSLEEHTKPVRTIVLLSDNLLVSGGNDGTLKVWDIQSGLCVKSLTGHTGIITTLAKISDTSFISGSSEHFITVWNWFFYILSEFIKIK